MNKRTKGNLKVMAILTVAVILLVFAIQTIFVGATLGYLSNAVNEAEGKVLSGVLTREAANEIYETVQQDREKLANSENAYTAWLASNDGMFHDMVAILVVLSPILFLFAVRWYNTHRRNKKAGKK